MSTAMTIKRGFLRPSNATQGGGGRQVLMFLTVALVACCLLLFYCYNQTAQENSELLAKLDAFSLQNRNGRDQRKELGIANEKLKATVKKLEEVNSNAKAQIEEQKQKMVVLGQQVSNAMASKTAAEKEIQSYKLQSDNVASSLRVNYTNLHATFLTTKEERDTCIRNLSMSLGELQKAKQQLQLRAKPEVSNRQPVEEQDRMNDNEGKDLEKREENADRKLTTTTTALAENGLQQPVLGKNDRKPTLVTNERESPLKGAYDAMRKLRQQRTSGDVGPNADDRQTNLNESLPPKADTANSPTPLRDNNEMPLPQDTLPKDDSRNLQKAQLEYHQHPRALRRNQTQTKTMNFDTPLVKVSKDEMPSDQKAKPQANDNGADSYDLDRQLERESNLGGADKEKKEPDNLEAGALKPPILDKDNE